MKPAETLTRIALRWTALALLVPLSCTNPPNSTVTTAHPANKDRSVEKNQAHTDAHSRDREKMVADQLVSRDIVNPRVLDAMQHVPRHKFVPARQRHAAYIDSPLPIGDGQTISQPYIVALMTQLVDPQSHHKALDVGTGSGYQAAVLAELTKTVFSIEIVESLANEARDRLHTLGYPNIRVHHGDGYHGWQSEAPFDVIMVAAAPDHIPQALIDQLARGGKLVIPVGEQHQRLMVVEKRLDGTVVQQDIAPVAFVPMTR